MLIVLVFLWLVLSPIQVIAQEVAPAPTATPSATLTPPSATETPVPGPSATPTTAAPTPTNTPTPKSVMKQTTSSQQGGFGGAGLVEEKEADTGLGFDKDNVQGATTSRDVDSAGDKDLLSTLIFLTAAIVLVVWTVYMILVQKGVIKSGVKKTQQKGGITPQPLQ